MVSQIPPRNRQERLGAFVQGINELNWFNKILDFVFKLTAFASEGLLALGVILSTANHFQHGALFSTTVPLAHGKSELVDTPIFQAWTWTQAIGFEASAGVVLARAIEANRDNDKLKRNILLWLMIGLALVGTVMLVMALVEASTGIQESTLPAWYGIFMAILRGIVSVAYVTIGRVKNLRFSGNPVMQPVEVPDVIARLDQLSEQMGAWTASTEDLIALLEARTERAVLSLTEGVRSDAAKTEDRIAVSEVKTERNIALLTEGVRSLAAKTEDRIGMVVGHMVSLQDVTESRIALLTENISAADEHADTHILALTQHLQERIDAGMVTLANALAEQAEVLSVLSDLSEQFGQFEQAARIEWQTVTEEVKVTVAQQMQALPKLVAPSPNSHRIAGPKSGTEVLPNSHRIAGPKGSVSPLPNTVPNSEDFDKGEFIRQCLREEPNISIGTIQRKALEVGQKITASYVSDVRKAFRGEMPSESETDEMTTLETEEEVNQ